MAKRTVVCDIEADGLLYNVTQIWCIVCKDWDTGEIFKWTPDNLNEFSEFASTVNQWIGHNFIAYDARVLKKILNIKIKPLHVTDTLLLSRLQKFTRKHSLAAWGEHLGFPKGNYEDFSKYTEEMLEYCVNDVELTYKVAVALKSEGRERGSEEASKIENLVTNLLEDQHELGFALDVPKADALFAHLNNEANTLSEMILDVSPDLPIDLGVIEPRYKKGGELSKIGLKVYGTDYECVGGPFSKIGWEVFNLKSAKQKVKRLEPFWSPYVPTKSGESWKICPENLATIYDDAPQELKALGEYAMLTARAKEVEGWLDALRSDDRVHGDVLSTGAVTHRMSHRSPNMANIPSSGSPYGEECRSCFITDKPDTHVILGCDASGIQLRILAHYMDDPDYTHEVLNGDVHTTNLIAMGIPKGELIDGQYTSRPIAKTFIYAWLLGAGDTKVGQIIGGTSEDGRRVKDTFLANTPALATLKLKAAKAAGLGRMVGLDGRKIEVKSEHYALSCYLQGGEAVVMKYAMILWHHWVKQRNLDARQVAVVHDEFQLEVRKEQADEVGELVRKSIIQAGKHFNLKCPMDGEYKTGLNWAETH
jgi:DNA polymerase-1